MNVTSAATDAPINGQLLLEEMAGGEEITNGDVSIINGVATATYIAGNVDSFLKATISAGTSVEAHTVKVDVNTLTMVINSLASNSCGLLNLETCVDVESVLTDESGQPAAGKTISWDPSGLTIQLGIAPLIAVDNAVTDAQGKSYATLGLGVLGLDLGGDVVATMVECPSIQAVAGIRALLSLLGVVI
jgi:hypothetical protein